MALTEEDVITMQFARWVVQSYPLVYDLFTHFPAGEYRPKKTARKLKDMGTKAGFPDFLLYKSRGRFNGLLVEIKVEQDKPSRVSDDQKKVIKLLRDEGYAVAVCYGLDECKRVFVSYMNNDYLPMRKYLTTMTKTERNEYDKKYQAQ